MRILLISQLFQPESFFKGLPFAVALKEKGHEVEVLTGFPHYPGGKVFPGYRIRCYQREVIDGVTVHRVPIYPSHDRSALRRMVSYLSLALSVLVLGPWVVRRPDVIGVYNLVTLAVPAYCMRWLFGSRVVVDVQDLWPESVANSQMLSNRLALGLLRKICDRAYRSADHLTVLSAGFKRELASRRIPEDKITIVHNWCDETALSAGFHKASRNRAESIAGKFVVLYAGSMGVPQGLNTLLDCAGLCAGEYPDVHFFMIGAGTERPQLESRARDAGLGNVSFMPPCGFTAMGEVYASADALVVHLIDEPLFRITIPSKTQAYLFIGKPIIMAMKGNASEFIRDAGAGIVCEPQNPAAMMQAIADLWRMDSNRRIEMGRRGHRYYMEHLSFERGVEKYERIMTALAACSCDIRGKRMSLPR